MIEKSYQIVLRKICDRLEGLTHPWAITGSLGLALQGVSIEVHDIDIQTDRQGAYEIEGLFVAEVVSPVKFLQSERIRSHFGQLEIDGCKVEIMGDMEKRVNDEWGKPPRLPQIIRKVHWENLTVPVLDLSYELNAYRQLKRTETAGAIEKALAGQRAIASRTQQERRSG